MTIGVVACSGDGTGNATSTVAARVTVATPDRFDDVGIEPGTGTAVVLDLPETATAGEGLLVPLEIRAGSEPYPWDSAALQIETEGPIIASADIDVSALEPESSVQGTLTFRPQAGTADKLTTARISMTLQLRQDSETTTSRGVEFGILADDRTTWMGYVSPHLLKLDRLQRLLDAGEISPAEYNDARTEILETVTGTVEELGN